FMGRANSRSIASINYTPGRDRAAQRLTEGGIFRCTRVLPRLKMAMISSRRKRNPRLPEKLESAHNVSFAWGIIFSRRCNIYFAMDNRFSLHMSHQSKSTLLFCATFLLNIRFHL